MLFSVFIHVFNRFWCLGIVNQEDHTFSTLLNVPKCREMPCFTSMILPLDGDLDSHMHNIASVWRMQLLFPPNIASPDLCTWLQLISVISTSSPSVDLFNFLLHDFLFTHKN